MSVSIPTVTAVSPHDITKGPEQLQVYILTVEVPKSATSFSSSALQFDGVTYRGFATFKGGPKTPSSKDSVTVQIRAVNAADEQAYLAKRRALGSNPLSEG